LRPVFVALKNGLENGLNKSRKLETSNETTIFLGGGDKEIKNYHFWTLQAVLRLF
jgi:hypothetical protein